MTRELSREERGILLNLARQTLRQALQGEKPASIDLDAFPPALREQAAAFVTLTKEGALRGCVGSIEAAQPLVKEVRDRALGAAFQDFRFPPLGPSELDQVQIEISRLTAPSKLDYSSAEDLLDKLRPGIDGVIMRHQGRRATFLPHVWEQLPDKELFLSRLCLKMGLRENAWKDQHCDVLVYQAEHFQEED